MSLPIRFSRLYLSICGWWAVICISIIVVPTHWQIGLLIALVAPTLILGLLLFRKSLFVKCDHCGSSGRVTYGHQEGYSETRLLFDCPQCGRVVLKRGKAHLENVVVCGECGEDVDPHDRACRKCGAPSKAEE